MTSCCAPRWRPEQATEAGHALDDELHLLTVHGILHLLGYDHAEPAEEKAMFRLQNELLDGWRTHRLTTLARARMAAADDAVLAPSASTPTRPAGLTGPPWMAPTSSC